MENDLYSMAQNIHEVVRGSKFGVSSVKDLSKEEFSSYFMGKVKELTESGWTLKIEKNSISWKYEKLATEARIV